MSYDEVTREEVIKENMIADSIEQQREYFEMQNMYLDNSLEC